jgi:hypothetical protein
MSKVKDLVKDNARAHFSYYVDGNLWYVIKQFGYQDFKFPVPIEDTKGAVFLDEHKAITLMRWIRKHLELQESGKDKYYDADLAGDYDPKDFE